MNHVYKVVFNKATGTYTAVAESAKSRGKSASSSAGIAGAVPSADSFARLAVYTAVMSAFGQTAWAGTALGNNNGKMDNFASTYLNCSGTGVGSASRNARNPDNKGNIAIGGGKADTRLDQGGNFIACAPGEETIAIGSGSFAGSSTTRQSVAIGANAWARSDQSIALGADARALGNSSIAIGGDDLDAAAGNNQLVKDYKKLTGDTIVARQYYPTRAGGEGKPGAVAVGVQAQADGALSLAFGIRTKATKLASIAVGMSSEATEDTAVALGTVAKATALHALAVGTSVDATAENAVAVGYKAKATAENAVAVGDDTQAKGKDSLALGFMALAEGANSIALGHTSKATKINSVAIGEEARAKGNDSLALGYKAKVVAKNGIAIGEQTLIAGNPAARENENAENAENAEYSIAIGKKVTVTAPESVGIGKLVTVSQKNSVVLGSNSDDRAAVTVASAESNGLKFGNFAGQASTEKGVVSFGSGGKERQLINVAAGQISETSTDAVNGSQLYATNKVLGNLADSVKTNFGKSAKLDSDGKIVFDNIGDTAKNTIHEAVLASRESVTAGAKSGIEVDPVTNDATGAKTFDLKVKVDGKTVTVNDKGQLTARDKSAKVSGSGAVEVKAGQAVTEDGVTVTPYTVDLQQKTKTDIAKGVAAKTAVDALADKQLGFTGDSGKVTRKLGENIDIKGGKAQAGQLTDGNIGVIADTANNTLNIKLAKNVNLGKDGSLTVGGSKVSDSGLTITGGPSVTKTGIDAGNKAIGNVAAGTEKHHAVNYEQLSAVKTTADNANQGWKVQTNNGEAETVSPGETVQFSDGSNIAITRQGQKITVATASEVSFDKVSVPGGGKSVVIGKDGIDAGSKKISNVGDAQADGDAVNYSQLKAAERAAKTEVAEGKNVRVRGAAKQDNSGATVYTVDAWDTKVAQASGGLVQVTGKTDTEGQVRSYSLDLTEDAKTKLNAGEQASQDIANKGVGFVGDSGEAVSRKLGEQLSVKGGAAADALTEGNIGVVSDSATNSLQVKLAKRLNLGTDGSVTIGGTTVSGEGLKISNGPSVTADGIDAGNKVISNVQDGSQNDHAVNFKQLTEVKNIANQGWKVKANDDAEETVAPGETVQFTGGDNIQISRSGKNITVATKKDVNFTNLTAEGAVLNKISVPAGDNNHIVIDSDGISAGNKKISKVGDATDNGDAVNYSQLKAVDAKVSALKDTALNFAGDSGDAVSRKLGEQLDIKGGLSDADALTDGNIGVVGNSAGNGLQVKLAKQLKLGDDGSVAIGAVTLNTDGLKITDGPSVTKTGIDAGNTVISNVQDGSKNDHAVNFKQLSEVKNTADNANQGWKVKANSGDEETVAPGQTLTLTDGDNIQISRSGKNITVATKQDVSFTKLTAGDAVLTKISVPAGDSNHIVIDSNGISAGDKRISNVGDAQDNGDAVNYKQLKAVEAAVRATKTEVVEGKNVHVDAAPKEGDSGAMVYKVSAWDTKAEAGSTALTVTPETEASNTEEKTRNYKIDLSEETKTSLTKADSALQSFTTSVNGRQTDEITQSNKNINFADGNATTAKADGKSISFDVKTDGVTLKVENGQIAANTSALSNTGGRVNTPDAATALVTAGDVAQAVNESGWKLAADGVADSELVKAGNTATFKAGKNLEVSRNGAEITYRTADDVGFNSVTFAGTDGSSAKISNEGGHIKLGDSNGQPVKITNVADGTEEGDAVNLKQLTEVKNAAAADTGDLQDQLDDLADRELGFMGDHGDGVTRKLGEELSLVGGAAKEDLTEGNIGIVADGQTGAMNVKLSKDLKLGDNGSVVIGGTTVNNEGLKITGGRASPQAASMRVTK
ncbi:ESPR-type extended signal peptide-containing protein [Neisseria leonii]|uniref:ESPR-type extended signal peptide-containing protein n=1 Tax=Neisseria leonii TaxID=2995413 RepID=A0AAQ3XKX1_9NEIS